MNKFFIYKIAATIFLSIFITHVYGQQMYDGQIVVTDAEVQQEGGLLSVSMNMDMSRLKVDNQRILTLTPVLVGSNNRIEFPEIIVSGNTRYKAYERSMWLDKKNMANPSFRVLRSEKDTKEVIVYEQIISFEPWMGSAYFQLKEDLCGCGGYSQLLSEEFIKEVSIEILPIQEPTVQPKPIEKERFEQRIITLHFPIGKAAIYDDYMDNHSQLAQLEGISRELKANENRKITALKIEGYASPDGGGRRNEELSRARVEALVQYLSANLDFPKDVAYTTNYVGEDWDGLISLVEDSSMDRKEAVLSIIRDTKDDSLREKKLEQLDGGIPYYYMLTNFYPKLRKVEYHISYIVKE